MKSIATIILTTLLAVIISCKSTQKTLSVAPYMDSISSVKMRNDTIRYLQTNIVGNKQKYIGLPLDSLLRNLKYDVKSCIVGWNYPKYDGVTSISLMFNSPTEYYNLSDKAHDARIINVEFVTTLPLEPSMEMYKKYHIFWMKDMREYYGKQVIKDLVVPGVYIK